MIRRACVTGGAFGAQHAIRSLIKGIYRGFSLDGTRGEKPEVYRFLESHRGSRASGEKLPVGHRFRVRSL